MSALAFHVTDVFNFNNGLKQSIVAPLTTIREQANAFSGASEFSTPTICLVNNEPVLRADWGRLISDMDNVVFLSVLQGQGEHGNDRHKVLRSVLLLGVAAAAFAFGGPLAGAVFGEAFGATAFGTALGGAVIGIGGTALVHALLPIPAPPSSDKQAKLAEASPTYSLRSRGNNARLGSAIPVVYGHHRIYPDFGATSYSEYIGNEQYVHQLMVIGHGDFAPIDTPNQVYIDDSPIKGFSDIIATVYKPGDTIPPDVYDINVYNVTEVSGQELIDWNTSSPPERTAPDTRDDFVGPEWVGPFIVEPAGTTTTTLKLDFGFPRGLFHVVQQNSENPEGAMIGDIQIEAVGVDIEYKLVDPEFGVPLPGEEWRPVRGDKSFVDNRREVLRVTETYTVDPGRHIIRVRKSVGRGTTTVARTGSFNDIVWLGARAELNQFTDYAGLTVMAMTVKATNNTNTANLSKIAVDVTRMLPEVMPDGTLTEPRATRSIASAIIDMCTNPYGGGVDASNLDLVALAELDTIWKERGDEFNAVFDRRQGIWECLTITARAGRTLPLLQAGRIMFVRDSIQSIPSGMFTTRNILPKTLSVSYALPSDALADSIDVEYIDERYWRPRHVIVTDPDAEESDAVKTNVQLFGCTNERQAMSEGAYLLNVNLFRRKLIKFQTELDGLIPTYGSLVVISHDMPAWGFSGDITGRDGNTFTTSSELPFEEGKSYVVAFRKRDGTMSFSSKDGADVVPFTVTPHPTAPNKFITTEEVDIPIDFDFTRESTQFAFGELESYAIKAKVRSIVPRGELKVELTCIEEDNRVHDDHDAELTSSSPHVVLDLSGTVVNYDVFHEVYKRTVEAFRPVSVTIRGNGVTIISDDTNKPALRIKGLHHNSVVRIEGGITILGRSGGGGWGGQEEIPQGSPGQRGGDAIYTDVPLTLALSASSSIYAGAGGGGGGGWTGVEDGVNLAGGGGGHGNQLQNVNDPAGRAGEGGTGTAYGGNGIDGGSGAIEGNFRGGTGGQGGLYGEAGSSGTNGIGSSTVPSSRGSAGGRAGRAIVNRSGTDVIGLPVDTNRIKGDIDNG